MFTSDEFRMMVGRVEVSLHFPDLVRITELRLSLAESDDRGELDNFTSCSLNEQQVKKLAIAFQQAADAFDRDGA